MTSLEKTKLILEARLFHTIQEQAEEGYPEEICGLLIGKFQEGTRIKEPTALEAMENVFEKKERYHRYTIDPKEYLRVELAAEKKDLEVVGIYHSHPNAPAKPSLFDQTHAWPTLSYLVIEVRDNKAINVMSWVLKADRSEFLQEELEIRK